MKLMGKGSVFESVVRHNLCIGCGACEVACPSNAVAVFWDSENGLPQAKALNNKCCCDKACGVCLQVCPFFSSVKSAREVADGLFSNIAGIHCHSEAGYWSQTYVGYAPEEKTRLSSASGGWVTFFLQELLKQGAISAAVCVGPSIEPASGEPLFEYRICSDSNSISDCSRSAYYPVSMSKVLQTIIETPGRYAIVVLPCMSRALRLLCVVEPILAERIVYTFGLVCGQVKTAHFSEFLAAKCGFSTLQTVNFRVKAPTYPNSNYGIRIVGNSGVEKGVNFSDIDRYWSDRFFTPMSCNLCADVFAETSDAVFLDAWTPGLMKDWQGWSYSLIRNPMLRDVFEQFATRFPEAIKQAAFDDVLASQSAVLVSKREDICWRMKKAEGEGKPQFREYLSISRQPRWGRRFISEATYEISKVSGDMWIQYRFDFPAFCRAMASRQFMANLARQIWRFSRVLELVMLKLRGSRHAKQ